MNRFWLYFFILFFFSTFGFGATLPTQAESISIELIKSKITELNARQGLETSTKNAVLNQYQAAQDNITSHRQAITQIANFSAALHQAPAQTKALQKEIEQATTKLSKQKIEDFSQIPVEELEQRLIIEKNKISLLDDQSKKLEADLTLQNNRPILIREESVAAQQLIENSRKKLEIPLTQTDSKLEIEAQHLYLKTLIEAKTTELKLLDVEAISQPARLELLKARIQLLDIQKNALAPVVATIENLAFYLRQQEAKKIEDVLSQSEKDIEGKHPLIQKFTRENIKYSRDLQTMTAKIEQISEQKTQIEIKTADIENEFKSADKKISLASLSPTLGKILREQRRDLVNSNEQQEGRKLQNETELTSLEQFEIEDKQKSLLNLDYTLKKLMATEVETTLPFEQRMMIQAELRVLLNNQKELLNKLALTDTTYLRTLGDLDFGRQQMLTQAKKFAIYLDERLLWVQSSEPVNLEMLSELYHSVQWLFSPSNWLEIGSETSRAIQNNRLLFSVWIVFLWLLTRLKSWTRQHLQVTETELYHWHTAHFYSTLQAFFYQILFTLPIPITVYLFGIFLTKNSLTDFSLAIGTGLQKSAITLFMGQFSYAIFAADGIVRRHFQWQKNTVLFLHTHFGWLRLVIVPAVFLIHATHTSKFSEYSDSLGRFALVVGLIAFTVFMTKILHHNLWCTDLKNHAPRLRYVVFALVITVPLTVIGAAVMGYYSSALELQEKLITTLRLLIFIVVIHEMVLRWLILVNRQLALKNAEQQRELHDKYDEESPLDIPKINTQTKKLLHVTLAFAMILGIGLIWKNLLPAFSFLDQIVLWQHKILIENQESYQPITLTNLLFAGLYFFIAVVAVRNFYGLLELLVFRRWEIEVGSRYATNQLAKYFFITVAFISISNELGGSWSQVQWLVAALGVGLGFGLQEIFANLVSGIILLFERPIRVGDVVTIGDVTGSVCRIQMRATTLIDIDQRELIVPNKTFITSQLTNWTLSNTTTRIVLPIGIAFDSNVEFAHDLMLQTVKGSALVLDTPEPSVLFIGFGESSLNFSICAFVKEPTMRWFVIHDLNMRLEKTLRENKIKIPYPQRDVHVLS